MISLVKISRRNDATKNRELSNSDHFRPIRLGKGATIMAPAKPPIGKTLPIHDSWSEDGMKFKGESDKFSVIFAIAGDDQPIEFPHDIPMIFATKQ